MFGRPFEADSHVGFLNIGLPSAMLHQVASLGKEELEDFPEEAKTKTKELYKACDELKTAAESMLAHGKELEAEIEKREHELQCHENVLRSIVGTGADQVQDSLAWRNPSFPDHIARWQTERSSALKATLGTRLNNVETYRMSLAQTFCTISANAEIERCRISKEQSKVKDDNDDLIDPAILSSVRTDESKLDKEDKANRHSDDLNDPEMLANVAEQRKLKEEMNKPTESSAPYTPSSANTELRQLTGDEEVKGVKGDEDDVDKLTPEQYVEKILGTIEKMSRPLKTQSDDMIRHLVSLESDYTRVQRSLRLRVRRLKALDSSGAWKTQISRESQKIVETEARKRMPQGSKDTHGYPSIRHYKDAMKR